MRTKPETYKFAELDEVIKLVEQCLREGAKPSNLSGAPGRSAIEVAADKLRRKGINYGHAGLRRRLEFALEKGHNVDWSLYCPPQYQKPASAQSLYPIKVLPPQSVVHSLRPVRVAVIPDIHVSPNISNERLYWIGRWVNSVEPDYIVQLGDWLTLDSMSTHEKPGSIGHKHLPTFEQDIAAGRESMDRFEDGLASKGGVGTANRIITLGNHEHRAYRYEGEASVLEGTLVPKVEQIYHEAGFRTVPYGQYVFIEGVGFIHHVNTTMGRAYGGKTSAQRIASDSVFSVIHGHSHTKQAADAPKVGPSHSVRAISAGCALPHGHVEDYAQHSTTGWWWGCLSVTLFEGAILDEHWTSMITLERKFAKKSRQRGTSRPLPRK